MSKIAEKRDGGRWRQADRREDEMASGGRVRQAQAGRRQSVYATMPQMSTPRHVHVVRRQQRRSVCPSPTLLPVMFTNAARR